MLTSALEMISLVPDGGLDCRVEYDEPGRERSLRQLISHLATIMRGFVAAENTNVFTNGMRFIPAGYAENATAAKLHELASGTGQQFARWWDEVGYDDPFERIVESEFTRSWTLAEAFERAVWHTAHHVRQLQGFLAREWGLTPKVPVTDDVLAGLPLPAGIYA